MKSIKNLISLGYLLMALLVIGIMYIWYKEWCDLEKLEVQNRHIDTFRQESHEIFVLLIELSLSGETVLEWEYADLEHYHYQRMAMDSMLCRFKTIYPTERIDSVRYLLEDKERQMHQIVQVLEQQQAINDKITRQVPVIVQKSVQEQPQKPKRKRFLGIFGKKEKPKPTVTTTMLRSLDRDMIAKQRAQSRRLSEHTDNLVARNAKLNRQLHGFIRQMDKKVQADLQKREAEITAMREQSFMQIGSLTGFVFLLLVISYIIIHRNANRIKRYKQKTTDLIGYSIPQIGKEFDLLRFGDNYIINIEIKTESSIDKIFKQQQKNKYYLEFLNKEIYIYTYILNENKLYKLIRKDSNNEIKEATFNELCNKLLLQEVVTFNNIDDLFNPSDYLVSPFNSPEKFMAEGYFLTVQQEQIYNEIRTKLSDATTKFIALTGSAGTGKTLLTYHIAKESIRKGEKVLILHCAPLNSGHKILMEEYGWSIHMPKYAPNTTDFDLIIIDEAQRMYPYQFDKYIEEVRTFNKKCIFSYDENQYLRDNEKNYHTKERIEKELSCTPYKLTDKIRTNKEIAYFIRQLFNLKKNISNIDYPNIELTYCKNYFSAKSLLQELSKKNWKVPNYTPGTRSTFHYEAYLSGDTECAHSVVGQEFDNVVIVIDDSFKYNSQGDLIADNTYYSQRQMLYQIITRTRKKLHIVIIDNEVMLDRCIDILNK